ncbi:Gfo/Idh/MocA family protein [Paenibacillus sp. MBLB4367]|uniref:Gfo/Idh/MocA family protein n=1 Tax=Paenibacillus sp. MBLB4367 TaxID=3384767 RepID=UPI0039081E8F
MKRSRIGLIGIGDIARKVYLPLLSQHQTVELAGVMSASAATVERTKATYRIPFGTTRLDELLALGLDAVFVHSPTETHRDIAMACLRSGTAVYVDKPLSYNIGESEEMAAYAEAKGMLLAVGFNRRYAPMYQVAKAWVEEAGGIDSCGAFKHRTKLQEHDAKRTIYDDLIHMLDLLLWLGGPDAEIIGKRLRADGSGRLLDAAGMLAFGDYAGRLGKYEMVRTAGADMEKLELHGSGRSAEVLNMELAQLYAAGAAPLQRTFGSWDTVLERRGFAGVVDHFLTCLNDPEACGIRADLTLPTHRLVERLAE